VPPAPVRVEGRLESLARESPELASYARLLSITLASAGEPAWAFARVDGAAAGPLRGEPALHGATLALPRAAMEGLWRKLAGKESDGLSLESLGDALCLHDEADPIVQLALMPALQAVAAGCAKALAEVAWTSGVCPVCVAWPALAESRGLDRPRVLRCGRCASEWKLPWQLCPFCGNDDHASLGYLYDGQAGESRRIFTCENCRGYLKTLATLGPLSAREVAVEDLATLALDLVALERGFERPAQPGFELDVRVLWDS